MPSNAVKFNLQYFSLKQAFCIIFPVFPFYGCHGIAVVIISFIYKTNRVKTSWAITYTLFLFMQGRDLGFLIRQLKKGKQKGIARQQEFLETTNIFKAKVNLY